eukprot:1244623-Rhodomonas_salina.1
MLTMRRRRGVDGREWVSSQRLELEQQQQACVSALSSCHGRCFVVAGLCLGCVSLRGLCVSGFWHAAPRIEN